MRKWEKLQQHEEEYAYSLIAEDIQKIPINTVNFLRIQICKLPNRKIKHGAKTKIVKLKLSTEWID
jgi:hypothetical protein